jgi:hypothetical protein
MKKTKGWFLLFMVLLLLPAGIKAQFDPDKVCRYQDGQLIFTLNLKWGDKEKMQVAELFDLDSLLLAKVYDGQTNITLGNETWAVKKLGQNLVELSKSTQGEPEKKLSLNDLFIIVDKWVNFKGDEEGSDVVYGVNKFSDPYVFSYINGTARFFLPNHKNAQNVYISGSFNDWSTTKTPMKFTGEGWKVELKLNPGKYTYKFIADGRWVNDPNNDQREKDNNGISNSVFFCCNHTFSLKGYTNARKVVVTGNFISWGPGGLAMQRNAEGWSLPVYLHDGTYPYKFIVDGQWMTDPANPVKRADANGNENSFISIGEPFLFKLNGFADAKQVVLTGSFNRWNRNELVMEKTEKGWQLPYVIAPGNYEYKFIIDGQWTWDLDNPFVTGSGDQVNSFMALKANHLFELEKYPDARKVILAGSFNGWNPDGYKMVKKGGKWVFPVYLTPGKYTYKFVVDGQWILDPANPLYEENEYETGNSVLWVKPPE